jgi:oligopeptidase B
MKKNPPMQTHHSAKMAPARWFHPLLHWPAALLLVAPLLATPSSLLRPDAAPAPRAERRPKELVSVSGDRRTDDYYWLNERDNPAVRAYLEAENAYADAVLSPVATLRETLVREMRRRVQEEDASVPFVKNGYVYRSRYQAGQEYPALLRRRLGEGHAEEVVIDSNQLAAGHEYFALGDVEVSPDNRLAAYSIDTSGRGLFQLRIRDLSTGRDLADGFPIGDAFAWANDSRTLLYDTKDPVTLRNDRIWRHRIGTAKGDDVLMHHEHDETQFAMLSKSRSGAYFLIHSGYTQTVEARVLEADRPEGEFRVIRPREPDIFYDVDHAGDRFFIRTNWQARNFRVMAAPVSDPSFANWRDVRPHRDDTLIEGVSVFARHLVTSERRGGLSRVRVTHLSDGASRELETGEPTFALSLERNEDFETAFVRTAFSSPRTPWTIIDFDLNTGERTIRKVQPVLGGFDPSNYATEFRWVAARDGTPVPVSLVYRKDTPRDGSAPCLLTGYGSYGLSYSPQFDRDRLSLLDRGFVMGIAHIRGGMEFGFRWYDEGRLRNKMNTFTDFIDCAEDLVRSGYTTSDRLFIEGRSAGGLLMGAVVNLRPDLFTGAIIGVPFVDVLTTMSDPTLPLTTSEYSEWGNPAVPEDYATMKRYSPYDNLRAGRYPHLLVTTSLADSQVQYFEPAKYVARLRTLVAPETLVLFRTNMAGSHGGASGRFRRLEERAVEYAWMLALLGRKD